VRFSSKALSLYASIGTRPSFSNVESKFNKDSSIESTTSIFTPGRISDTTLRRWEGFLYFFDMATAETVYRQFQRNQEILPLQLNSFVGFLNSLGHDQVFSFLTTNNTRSEISQIVRRVILMSLVQHNNVIKLTPKTKHIPSFALFHRLPGEEN
jgi:hypothetical protein